MIVMLLGGFGIAFAASAIICLLALRLFPWFRSGERKPGDFKPDESTGSGSFQIEVRRWRARPKVVRARSSELPLVGGVAMILAIIIASVVTGMLLNLDGSQWLLMGIILLATVGYGFVGLIDDVRKVYRGIGISELAKAIGVVLVSGATAALLNRLVTTSQVNTRLAYPPYSQAPLIGSMLVKTPHAWLIFFLLMTIVVGSVTALAVDFSDGMDGMTGGLVLSAGLAYAVILVDAGGDQRLPLIIGALVLAGAALGYLPFNWPSSRRGGTAGGKRWAKLIMGDTGSLALGGMLAIIAIVARQEIVLVIIGGAFVLEGLSALISARILVKFYRRFLFVERFGSSRGFPHTEFPLPFLATPMHHHYDLLNIDRKRIVYSAWLLGAGLGVLGIATAVGPFTWERYLARLAALALLLAVWQAGPWTKAFFIGLEPANPTQPEAPRRLALCHGAPFRLFGVPMYRRIDTARVTDRTLQEPSERLMLWQRLSVFDARSLLGFFCYREGDYEDAQRIWDRLPDGNIEMRPDIKMMIGEVTHEIDRRKGVTRSGPRSDPAATNDPSGSAWRSPVPPMGLTPSPRLTPLGGQPPYAAPQPGSEALLWQPERWAEANGMAAPYARDPNQTYPPAASAPDAMTTPRMFGGDLLGEFATPPPSPSLTVEPDPGAMVANTSSPGAPGMQRPSESGDL